MSTTTIPQVDPSHNSRRIHPATAALEVPHAH
jgi:hypothetical protein